MCADIFRNTEFARTRRGSPTHCGPTTRAGGYERGLVDAHDAAARRVRFIGCLHDRRAHLGQHRSMLFERRAPQSILERNELVEALELQYSLDERMGSRPSRRIDLVPRKRRVAKEAREAYIGDGDAAEDEAVGWNLCLEVVEHLRDIVAKSRLHHRRIRFLAPHVRLDHDLTEQLPDEH